MHEFYAVDFIRSDIHLYSYISVEP